MVGCLLGSYAWARIPTGLSQSDIDRLIEYLGPPATTRLLRSADAYDVFPGLRFAVEVSFLPTGEINDLGDKNGTFAGLNPTPRFSFSKGIGYGLEFQLNYFPENIMNVLSSMGGSVKWMIIDERESEFSGSVYGAYTNLSGFEQSFTGRNIELGAVFSKDFVRLRPFAGAGLIFSTGKVASNFAVRSNERDGTHYTVHSYLGCEILLPMNVTVEIDMMNLSPMLTLLVGMVW